LDKLDKDTLIELATILKLETDDLTKQELVATIEAFIESVVS
jgi:hypothetical protein